jgi:hypothetical protein
MSTKEEIMKLEEQIAMQTAPFIPPTQPVQGVPVPEFPSIPNATVALATPEVPAAPSLPKATVKHYKKEQKEHPVDLNTPAVPDAPEEPKRAKKDREVEEILALYKQAGREAPTLTQLRKLKAAERAEQIESLKKYLSNQSSESQDQRAQIMDAIHKLGSNGISVLADESLNQMDIDTLNKYLGSLQEQGIAMVSNDVSSMGLINFIAMFSEGCCDAIGRTVESTFPRIRLAKWGTKLRTHHDQLVECLKGIYAENKEVMDKYLSPTNRLVMILLLSAGEAMQDTTESVGGPKVDPQTIPQGADC